MAAVVLADVSHLTSTSTEHSLNPEDQQTSDGSGAAPEINSSTSREYLPPPGVTTEPIPAHTFGADGYKYKEPQNKFFF